MTFLGPIVSIYDLTLQPAPPFTYLNLPISTLDLIAAVRLCVALRQLREINHRQHAKEKGKAGFREAEKKSYVKDILTTLVVVFGGDAIVGPLLGFTPSFMTSGTIPLLYAAIQVVVEQLPSIPAPSFGLELPLAILDGFTRAYLLCSLIPPVVIAHTSPAINISPWSLLVTSLVTANAGFFIINLTSFLQPTPLALTTPPEIMPYGWTTADLWCAPMITGIYALLTEAQPIWAELHHALVVLLGGGTRLKGSFDVVVKPVDPATARAFCAILLCGLFSGRAVKNFEVYEAWLKKGRATSKTKSE